MAHRRQYLMYVDAVSREIVEGKRWTSELVVMLSRRFGIQKTTAYKILRSIYAENIGEIERHRIGNNEMKISPLTLVWRGKKDLMENYLDGQMTVRMFADKKKI